MSRLSFSTINMLIGNHVTVPNGMYQETDEVKSDWLEGYLCYKDLRGKVKYLMTETLFSLYLSLKRKGTIANSYMDRIITDTFHQCYSTSLGNVTLELTEYGIYVGLSIYTDDMRKQGKTIPYLYDSPSGLANTPSINIFSKFMADTAKFQRELRKYD